MFLNCHESVGDLSDGRLHGSDLSGERGLLSLSAGYGGARDLFGDCVDLAAGRKAIGVTDHYKSPFTIGCYCMNDMNTNL